ncbi:zinc-ribbon domain-containing protein [Hespellia stercorisuis]|uniref:Zinc-ribbon domain-containing protein n=1 Tax=Hespellia stercorisuis DSM 15480 TaxID=1121950 RepID=A0A1M6NUQ7_9FIRM|nr:zinc ribbon domain-containing protein [Hespellia stercorisuis]SHJ99381.1 zinc-ribbon domain-containing protein [Hespellia stercorisuis DSM 15480]
MFCKKCGKEVQEGWSVCPNCGEAVPNSKVTEKPETIKKSEEKVRGTSNAPIILGITGGALGLPSALCSSMCSGMVGAMDSAESANELGSFYLVGMLIGSVIAIVFACYSRKAPKTAGIMLIVATIMIGGLSVFSFNLLGIISAILTLIAGIICFLQKKNIK